MLFNSISNVQFQNFNIDGFSVYSQQNCKNLAFILKDVEHSWKSFYYKLEIQKSCIYSSIWVIWFDSLKSLGLNTFYPTPQFRAAYVTCRCVWRRSLVQPLLEHTPKPFEDVIHK